MNDGLSSQLWLFWALMALVVHSWDHFGGGTFENRLHNQFLDKQWTHFKLRGGPRQQKGFEMLTRKCWRNELHDIFSARWSIYNIYTEIYIYIMNYKLNNIHICADVNIDLQIWRIERYTYCICRSKYINSGWMTPQKSDATWQPGIKALGGWPPIQKSENPIQPRDCFSSHEIIQKSWRNEISTYDSSISCDASLFSCQDLVYFCCNATCPPWN